MRSSASATYLVMVYLGTLSVVQIIESNNWTINGWWFEKAMEENIGGLGTMSECAWRGWGRPWRPQDSRPSGRDLKPGPSCFVFEPIMGTSSTVPGPLESRPIFYPQIFRACLCLQEVCITSSHFVLSADVLRIELNSRRLCLCSWDAEWLYPTVLIRKEWKTVDCRDVVCEVIQLHLLR